MASSTISLDLPIVPMDLPLSPKPPVTLEEIRAQRALIKEEEALLKEQAKELRLLAKAEREARLEEARVARIAKREEALRLKESDIAIKAVIKEQQQKARLAELAIKEHEKQVAHRARVRASLCLKERKAREAVELAIIRLRQLEERCPDSISALKTRVRYEHLCELCDLALYDIARFDDNYSV